MESLGLFGDGGGGGGGDREVGLLSGAVRFVDCLWISGFAQLLLILDLEMIRFLALG